MLAEWTLTSVSEKMYKFKVDAIGVTEKLKKDKFVPIITATRSQKDPSG